MGKYKKPRRINAVSFLLILALIGCGYAGWKFGPPYWRKWGVKRVLSEAANSAFRLRGALANDSQRLDALRDRTRQKVREAGVVDPSLRIHVTLEQNRVAVSAEYHEIIQHLFIKKLTKLYFHPSASAP
ncbi:MAG: hypothetical protein KC503_31760 [Myxococcales bacterium]|nr:hypothetical protein [Myxococcales bacterium]